MTTSRFVRREFAVFRKREPRQMINAKIFDKTGICRFPQAGAPRQEYGFAVLTNQGRIHGRLQKKMTDARLHSSFLVCQTRIKRTVV